MKLKGIIVAVIIIGIILAILGGIYFLGHTIGTDLEQEQILRQEIAKLNILDMMEDDYNTPVQTTGIYGEIESTIKQYLASYAESTKKANALVMQMREMELLTNENYKQDGPEFTQSFATIQSIRDTYNTEMDNLIACNTTQYVIQLGEEKNWDSYFLALYKDCILGTDYETEFAEVRQQLEDAKTAVNSTLDQQEKVLQYLKDNKENWQVSSTGKLEFHDQKTLDGYAALAVQPEESKEETAQ